jgi:NAD(P)-dependent dehydrogenase (short-subunit alcohol dehydrogenase family)
LPARSVLVTGASSGIGAACASRLAASGWEVYAAVRTPGDAPAETTEVLLDVTDPEAIASLSFDRLDALVNNAGIAIAAPLEDLPIDELRRQLEVNVVGQLAVTKRLLPALRAARGRIVIVGSIAGRSALPFLGAYAISKFALEAMADALRLELAPDGIEVSLVEPGTIATPIWSKPQPLADGVSERYGPRIEHFRAAAAARAAKAAPAGDVAEAVAHALTAERPKSRYLVGRDAKIRAAIERLPDRARDRVIRRALLGG